MWLLAVGAGVAETVVAAGGAIHDGISLPALAAQLAVRAVVYGALFVVIDRYFRRGIPWSRYLLVGLLGTVGLASLLYEPLTWLTEQDLSAVPWSAAFLLTATIRTIHLSALLAAVTLTLHPQTTRWFRR
ncbi:hypothetical protein GCM10009743_70340 [Kribbella swartbergensis]